MTKRTTGEPRARRAPVRGAQLQELAELRRRLEEAEESLDAIHTGAVDALVIKGPQGDQIYTLKDADRPYRIVIENMRDGALTVREDGLVLYANKQMAAMLGVSLEDFLGGNLFERTAPAGREDLLKLFDKALLGGAHGDVEFRGSDGRALLIYFSLAPMRIDATQVLAGVGTNVTEERESQQRTRQMERTEALGRLAGGVAHDLNNILQPILVNSELLLDEAEPGSPQHALLTNVIEAAHRQKELVTRILSFTRQSKQMMVPQALTPLVIEALNLLKPSLPAGVEVKLTADSVMDTVIGDPTELHEIVTNLCSNAADSMETTGGVLEVSIYDVSITYENAKFGLKPGRYLKLAVKDSGCGIPPQDLERIFEPFFTTKETGRGTGIGLSVVRGIVKSHGGSIVVESQVGRGTEVAVFLPTANVPQFAAVKGAPDWRVGRGPGRRILLVDDEDMVLDSMRRALSAFGHKPTAVRDATAALTLFRTLPRHFDLAVVDQRMPRMSGLELAAEFRKVNPDMPILLATGYSKAANDKSLRDAGVTAIVMKPLSLKDLAAAVNQALASASKKA